MLERAFAEVPLAAVGDVVGLARRADGEALVVVPGTDGATLIAIRDERAEAHDGAALGELVGVEPLGDGFVALALGACASEGSARCLRAVGVADAAPIGPGLEIPQAGRLRSLRVTATDGLVYLARSYRDAPPTLDRFMAGDAAVERTALRIGDGLSPEEPVEMLALAADGAAFALLYRHGATEDPASGVVLATQLDEHHVEVLHDALVVESIAWVGTSIALVAAFEFARPSYLRLGADGEVRVAPRLLPFGTDVPEPFAARLVARVEGGPGSLELEVRDGAGDRRGPRIALPGARAADLSREPGGFLVAWLDAAGVRLAHLRC